jgi:hypothetical protein
MVKPGVKLVPEVVQFVGTVRVLRTVRVRCS